MPKHSPWLSVEEADRHFVVSKETTYNGINLRNMPDHRLGWLWKFQAVEIGSWGAATDIQSSPEDRERH